MKRPGPVLWLRYLVTSDLPDEYDEWVLLDTTCATWLIRHTLRFLSFIAPFAALVVLFLPAPVGLRWGCVVVGVLGSAAISFGYTVEGAERRVEKAGYAYGTAERTRQHAADERQRAVAAKNRAPARRPRALTRRPRCIRDARFGRRKRARCVRGVWLSAALHS